MPSPEEAAAARALELLGGHVEEEDTTEEEQAQVRTEFSEGLDSLTDTQPKNILGESPSSDEPAAEAEAQHEAEEEAVELPELNPQLPDELAEELSMPDWDEEEELPAVEVDDDEEDEYEDDERVLALKSRLRKAEKRAQWADEQRASAKREKWETEARKYFPLSEHALENITATSRRGFLREAKKAHESVQPHVESFVAKLHASQKKAVDAAVEEALERAKEAWGKPTVSPGGRESTTTEERNKKLREAKTLEERIKTRIFG